MLAVVRANAIFVDIDAVTSLDAVLAELTGLQARLASNELHRFLVFNKAYLLVTAALQRALHEGYFKNPEFVEKFTVCFAVYYFRVINDTANDDPGLPTAWAMAHQAGARRSTPDFILLLMGANAHINSDLPLTMLQLTSEIDEAEVRNLLKDILKVDKLLMKTGREIVTAFQEPNKQLEWLKHRLAFLYYRPVMYMILYWRIKAWRSYKSIKKVGIESSDYQKGSARIARRFLKLSQFLSH